MGVAGTIAEGRARRRRPRFGPWPLAWFVATTPAPALGQGAAPPEPTLNRYPQPWVGFLVIAVLVAIVVVVSLLSSKRGHQH